MDLNITFTVYIYKYLMLVDFSTSCLQILWTSRNLYLCTVALCLLCLWSWFCYLAMPCIARLCRRKMSVCLSVTRRYSWVGIPF